MPQTSPTENIDLLIVKGHVLTMDAQLTEYPSGAVAIKDGRILAVGEQTGLKARFHGGKEINAGGGLIIPGLINTHCHAAMTWLRGAADDVALGDFLDTVWAAESRLINYDTVLNGALIGCAEMALGGITTVADMYWHPQGMVDASQRIGISVATGPAFIGFEGIDGLANWPARLDYTHEFFEHNKDKDGVQLSLAPHSTYTLNERQLQDVAKLAGQYDVLVQVHAAEARTEMDAVQQQYQRTPVQVLADTGILEQCCVIAHGVHLNDADQALLAHHSTAVSHCPQSNAKTAAGIAPIVALSERHITVSLGTDGASTGNDLDLWKAMRLAAFLQKLDRQDSSALPARQVLTMATLGGATALGVSEETGSLELGKRADVVVVSTAAMNMQPVFDPYSALVYSAGREDVQHVVARGKHIVAYQQITGEHMAPILEQFNATARQVVAPNEATA